MPLVEVNEDENEDELCSRRAELEEFVVVFEPQFGHAISGSPSNSQKLLRFSKNAKRIEEINPNTTTVLKWVK